MNKYIYRFLDDKRNVVYIGKTNNLRRRLSKHFNNGHLEEEQYKKVRFIEYMLFVSKADQRIAEIYLINKYKPSFNRKSKEKDYLTLQLNIKEDWIKLDKEITEKVANANTYPRTKNETPHETIQRLEAEIKNLVINLEIEREISDESELKADKERREYERIIGKLKEAEYLQSEQLYINR